MYDFATNDYVKKTFIVFYDENGEYLTVYYADGSVSHFDNTKQMKDILNMRMKKQIDDSKDFFMAVNELWRSYKIKNTTDIFFFVLTFLTSINIAPQSMTASFLVFVLSLIVAFKKMDDKEKYEALFELKYDYLKHEFFITFEDDFNSMNYKDLRLYDGVSEETVLFILQSDSDIPFDINTIDIISFRDLVLMLDNFNKIRLEKDNKLLKMEFKDEEKK